MAIGVDIEDISRFKDKPDSFYSRIFSVEEIEYCKRFPEPEGHYAVRFCAKEAVIKALSAFGISAVLSDVEVFHDKNGCPQIKINEKLNKKVKFQLSLSHDKSKAVAFVIAEEL